MVVLLIIGTVLFFKNNDEKNDIADRKKTTTSQEETQRSTDNNPKLPDNKTNIKNDTSKSQKSNKNNKIISNQKTNKSEQPASKKTQEPLKKYICSNGWTLNGVKCQMKSVINTSSELYCESGTLSNGKCQVVLDWYVPYCGGEEMTPALSSCCMKYGGEIKHGDIGYYCLGKKATTVDAKEKKYCIDGYTLEGDKCIKIFEVDAIVKQYCPNGWTLNGDICEKN